MRDARCAGLDYVITTITVMYYEASPFIGAERISWGPGIGLARQIDLPSFSFLLFGIPNPIGFWTPPREVLLVEGS